jgi:gamma-glutamyltranspeptidase/glutathione hydrolase
VGEIFRNPAQANSLELIARTNGEAFYRGELAQKLPPSPESMART